MDDPLHHVVPMTHGEHCSCRLLAKALGRDPSTLSYEYCHRVLQKHWRMTCQHERRHGDNSTSSQSESHDWAVVIASALTVTAGRGAVYGSAVSHQPLMR